MDNLEELRKLKRLFDDGLIDEEDFKNKKAQIIGGSNIEHNSEGMPFKSTNTMSDYEAKLEEELEIIEKGMQNKLDEQRQRIQSETIEKQNKKNRILKWIATVFCGIAAVAGISTPITEPNDKTPILWILLGIIFLILGIMACPKITDKTKKFENYTKYKKIIVWTLIVVVVILSNFVDKNTLEKTRYQETQKETSKNIREEEKQ